MRSLFLLRHAHAGNAPSGGADFERPLDLRGRLEAKLIGIHLSKQVALPDCVLSSPAIRARETIEIVAATANLAVEVRYNRRVYEASPAVLMQLLAELEESFASVLLVGHNPGMVELLELLTRESASMSPATLAKIDFKSGQWRDALAEEGELDWLVGPKDLERG